MTKWLLLAGLSLLVGFGEAAMAATPRTDSGQPPSVIVLEIKTSPAPTSGQPSPSVVVRTTNDDDDPAPILDDRIVASERREAHRGPHVDDGDDGACDSCGEWGPCDECGGEDYQHQAECDMPPHWPYLAEPKMYYYFRPYQWFHIEAQQAEASGWGTDPRNPYDNRGFQAIYENVEAEYGLTQSADSAGPAEQVLPAPVSTMSIRPTMVLPAQHQRVVEPPANAAVRRWLREQADLMEQ